MASGNTFYTSRETPSSSYRSASYASHAAESSAPGVCVSGPAQLVSTLRLRMTFARWVLTDAHGCLNSDQNQSLDHLAGSSFSFPISAGKEESAELGSTEYEAHAAVISGLVETLETLRKRNNGRFPTKDRITQEVILNSVVANAKGSMLNSIARLLHIRPNTVHKAAARQQPEASLINASVLDYGSKH